MIVVNIKLNELGEIIFNSLDVFCSKSLVKTEADRILKIFVIDGKKSEK